MTKLSDILSTCNIEAIYQPEIGDVFLINLTREEGITPKTGDDTRNKFYIVFRRNKKLTLAEEGTL